MKYKLVSCDLDGSLLDDNKTISINIIKKIKELEKSGVIFVVATGRPYASAKRYLQELDNDALVILYNGAVIRNNKNGETIFNDSLTDSDAREIIKRIIAHDGTYIYWKEEVAYVNRMDDYNKRYAEISKIEPLLDDFNYQNITKIIWFNEKEKHIEYEKEFNDLVDVNHFTSEETYLEFVSKGASKEKALDKICKYYKINKEEVIAIGDGNNDIGMIRYAGLGVTLENANDNVKKWAKYIAKPNNDEGVLEVLNKYF